jgi:hypothetical protein
MGVMDDLQVPEKDLRCEACGWVIKPERDEKVERVTDENGVVRVFCGLERCRQERLQVHIRAFNARIAPERATTARPPKPMVYMYASRAGGRSKWRGASNLTPCGRRTA